jgi:hypothetical protein
MLVFNTAEGQPKLAFPTDLLNAANKLHKDRESLCAQHDWRSTVDYRHELLEMRNKFVDFAISVEISTQNGKRLLSSMEAGELFALVSSYRSERCT